MGGKASLVSSLLCALAAAPQIVSEQQASPNRNSSLIFFMVECGLLGRRNEKGMSLLFSVRTILQLVTFFGFFRFLSIVWENGATCGDTD
jgi:hypothetical protein